MGTILSHYRKQLEDMGELTIERRDGLFVVEQPFVIYSQSSGFSIRQGVGSTADEALCSHYFLLNAITGDEVIVNRHTLKSYTYNKDGFVPVQEIGWHLLAIINEDLKDMTEFLLELGPWSIVQHSETRFTIRHPGIEIYDEGCLIGFYGEGKTPVQAIQNHYHRLTNLLEDQYIVRNAYKEDRAEFQVVDGKLIEHSSSPSPRF